MLKNSLIYTSTSILSAVIPFLLLPILTRLLSPEDYGQIAMFTIFTTALSAFVGLSVHGAAGRRYFDGNVTDNLFARYNWNCILILFASTLFVLLMFTITDVLVAEYLDLSISMIYLGILSVFFGFLFNLRLTLWQVSGNAKRYGFTQILSSVVGFLLSLCLVIELHLGAEGRIYGVVISSVLIGFFSIWSLLNDKKISFEYNKNDFRDALDYGVPLIPHVVGGFLLLSVDRLVINKKLGLDMTGIYMVAVSLGGALNIVFNSINKAYAPWLFGQLKEAGKVQKLRIVRYTYFYFLFLIMMSILSYFISPSILRFVVGEQFYAAADVLPIIVIGQVFLGMYFMCTNYIFYVKKTKYLSYITISSGSINILLLFLLIPIYGISGAALAFMIANFCQFTVTWLVSSKLYVMPWALWRKND